MSDTPLVSIGVPVYNGEQFLARTLQSLLAQTYTNLEIIICDNASTDGTEAICREFAARDVRIRYVRNASNIGAIPNFRRTLDHATGQYFAWTPADDVRPAQAIEHCVAAFATHRDAVMVHGQLDLDLPREGRAVSVANHLQLETPSAPARVREFTKHLEHVAMLFGLYRRDVLQTVPFGNHMAADYFVCLLVCERGPVVWVPSPILIYRHQYGALDNPMYERVPITFRDLLLHRGVRRRKCWMGLGIGIYYLWRHSAPRSASARVSTVRAFAAAFVGRFHRAMASELVFFVFAPASWVAAPLAPFGRRIRRAMLGDASTALR
jgi:glycosyltransferase involved in cell wall biosynthesis